MRKTLLNSVIFISISTILLVTAMGGIILYGITIYRGNSSIITLITTIIIAMITGISGFVAIYEVHCYVFKYIDSNCDVCDQPFQEKDLKKQAKGAIDGKMYVSYRCPTCNDTVKEIGLG